MRDRLRTHGILKTLAAGVVLCAGAAWVGAQTPATAPGTVSWTARDAKGGEIAVPAAGKISVVVFLRAGQSQSEEEAGLLGGLLKDRKEVQIIGVVSGDDAAVGAVKLNAAGGAWATSGGGAWPVVVDGDYAASGKFNARVWPTTVVIGKSGEPVAHIAGLPVSFANDFAAYLDYAGGKIDKAALEKKLADLQVVADSADQKAARHVEVAQRLAVKGMHDESRRELVVALSYGPKDDAVVLSIVRTQLINHDAADALAMLGQVRATGNSGSEMNLMKGWCAVEQGKWEDARKILGEDVKLNPNPAEALYLLGLVYEHDGDAKQAAECFRKAFEHSAAGKAMGT